MALALEGTPVHNNASSGTSLVTGAFTTTQAAEVFISVTLNIAAGKTVSSITGGGLTWARRTSVYHSTTEGIELWAAQAASALSAVAFTVNTSGAIAFITTDVFAFSGQDTTTIWDGNAAIPASGVVRPITYSTSNANDVIISCFRMSATASPTQGTGFTKISGANFQLAQYKINSATETGATADTGASAASNGGIVDALMQASAVSAVHADWIVRARRRHSR